MKGWFDAFRINGGPTLYNFNNRTAVTGDVTLITFLTIFITLYVAFLIIFPGIRKERFTTFLSVTLSIFVGTTILVSLFGSDWHVGQTAINCSYRAFSNEKLKANLNVYIGLQHVNITLRAHNWSADIDFNERFYWYSSGQMDDSFKNALYRGLPYPILTVAEYFNTGQEGLSWGIQYRTAGYYAIIILWTSFASWLLMNLMLIVVPRYGAALMVICGVLLVSASGGYMRLLPENQLIVRLESSSIHFRFGWCFWLVLSAGGLCIFCGSIISIVEMCSPNSFSTILEVDFDTPYDRHIIIEDSKGRRYQKKRHSHGKLEETPGFSLGTKILRRLSSKNREESIGNVSSVNSNHLELKTPKSTWRYPFEATPYPTSDNAVVPRSESQLSTSSTTSKDLPHIHKDFSRMRHHNKNSEVSMW